MSPSLPRRLPAHFERRLAIALDRPAIVPDSDEALDWRARADILYAGWPAELASLPPFEPKAADVAATMAAIEVVLEAIAAHPPALPCHGVTHTIRVLSHSLRIIRRDRLSTADALRLQLAAALHDLGRLLLHRDQDGLRHADISAVLFESLRDSLSLPPGLTVPVRHAVLLHSAKRLDFEPVIPRVIDDLRSADKLDALDEIGFVRAMLYQGSNDVVSIRPQVGKARVLYGWWKNIERIEPVLVSRSERDLIDRARERSRRIGDAIGSFKAPPETLEARFWDAVAAVEPDANREASERTLARLYELPRPERAVWAGLLTAIVAEVHRLEDLRLRDTAAATRSTRPEVAALASLLLAWSHRVGRLAEDLPRSV